MTDKLTQSEEELALERIVRNKLEIDRLLAENAEYLSFFKGNEAYPAGTNKNVGKFFIKVTTNKRIDDALAKQVLPARTYNGLTKKVIDPVMAKKSLPGAYLTQITKVYDNKIEVGLR